VALSRLPASFFCLQKMNQLVRRGGPFNEPYRRRLGGWRGGNLPPLFHDGSLIFISQLRTQADDRLFRNQNISPAPVELFESRVTLKLDTSVQRRIPPLTFFDIIETRAAPIANKQRLILSRIPPCLRVGLSKVAHIDQDRKSFVSAT
jgi:hypothetical protein